MIRFIRWLASALTAMVFVGAAHAADLVVSTGLASETGPVRETRVVSTFAIRGFTAPGFVSEASVRGMRSALHAQLSLWRPVGRAVYVGGGGDVALPTSEGALFASRAPNLGYHLGGGLLLPLTRGAGLDVSARYVFLDRRAADVAPDRFSSRFWTATVGVSFHM